ncbi:MULTISPECIES: helix-turn-helix domain-containing protein [unclassified Bacillus (in: firmicutes)]
MTAILEKPVLEVKDIQNFMGIGKRQAYDLVKKGFFPAHKIGTVYPIPAKAFFNWFNGASE